jgi:hypothetical protein
LRGGEDYLKNVTLIPEDRSPSSPKVSLSGVPLLPVTGEGDWENGKKGEGGLIGFSFADGEFHPEHFEFQVGVFPHLDFNETKPSRSLLNQ